ncbi:MAG: PQQ-dependent sugar dehydrogenase [Phycisphaera sp.]|nr:MAG: PQQ-dependent sugar dehydrogenase [Phycisphaera sp.]
MNTRLFAVGLLAPASLALAQLDETTSFEDITSSDFVIGTPPISAHFTGGDSISVGDLRLYRTGLFSWMVFDDGRVGRIDFDAPADIVDFWLIDSAPLLAGEVRVFGLSGETLATIDPTLEFTNERLEGLGPIAAIEVVNTDGETGESTVIDDFGFRAVRRLANPIAERISTSDVDVRLELVADGMAAPNLLITAPDGSGRLFVVDQAGQVRIIEDGTLLATPFLDVADRLVDLGIFGTGDPFGDFDERGLLGLAFHPDYANAGAPGFGKLYTYISEPVAGAADFTTASPPPAGREFDHQTVIHEWQVDAADPDRVDPASVRELMRIDQPQFNHNAGHVEFGPDGLLYIALGDGGGADDEDGQPSFGGPVFGHGPAGNGQDTSTALGSILRIDPLGAVGAPSANGEYSVPGDNPFVGSDGVDEIFAYGMRNPFRFAFAPDGRMIVADVGQNDLEEVSFAGNGDNLGWRILEGSFRFVPNGEGNGFVIDNLDGVPSDLVDPAVEYDHDEGLSSIGGYVYTGAAIPALRGRYVFGDFSLAFDTPTGRLFHADLDAGELLEFPSSVAGLDTFVKGFGQDDAGEVYVLAGRNLGPFGDFGEVYRLVAACRADLDGDGVPTLFDFLAFQNFFDAGDPAADFDGDGSLTIFDFLTFQNEFDAGCP